MKKQNKTWSYPICMEWKDTEGKINSYATQLYKVGVYCTINNDPSSQMNLTPAEIVKMTKKIKNEFEVIAERNSITVTIDKDGFYVKLIPCEQ